MNWSLRTSRKKIVVDFQLGQFSILKDESANSDESFNLYIGIYCFNFVQIIVHVS